MRKKLPNVKRIFLMSDNPSIIDSTKSFSTEYEFYYTKERRYNDDAAGALNQGQRDTDEGKIS
jgi:hypothetical protein